MLQLALLVTGPPVAARAVSEAPAATHDLATIEAGLQAWDRAFLDSPNFLVECTWTSSRVLVPSRYGDRPAPFDLAVGRLGGQWYSRTEDRSPRAEGEAAASPRQRRVVFKQGASVNVADTMAIIGPYVEGAFYSNQDYFENLGLCVQQRLPDFDPRSIPFPYPFVLELLRDHRGEYRVQDRLEQVDGAWCHRVEWPGFDVLWVDPALGFAIRQRQFHHVPEKPYHEWRTGGPLRQRVLNQDFREVKPGLRLPFRQIVDLYGEPYHEDAPLAGQAVNRRVMRVKRIEFDTLDESFFDVGIPPGTLVHDLVRGLTFRTARPGEAAFADAIAFGERSAYWRGWTRLGFLCLGVAGAVAALVVLGRRIVTLRSRIGDDAGRRARRGPSRA